MRIHLQGRRDLLGGRPADDQQLHRADNAAFFAEILPGRDAPLGMPGGATGLGPVGVDTALVAAMPVRA